MIDRKYKIMATNPCSGSLHTEMDSILFLAKDLALLPTLEKYREECALIGCDDDHLVALDMLIQRVIKYQEDIKAERADLETVCEKTRCLGIIGMI